MMLALRNIKFAFPAEKGWYGKFNSPDSSCCCDVHYVPIVAWAYAEYAEPGNDFDYKKGTRMWTGVGIWEDGPEDCGSFANFAGYVDDETMAEEKKEHEECERYDEAERLAQAMSDEDEDDEDDENAWGDFSSEEKNEVPPEAKPDVRVIEGPGWRLSSVRGADGFYSVTLEYETV